MACADCRARAALVAELAPAIERIGALSRDALLGLLALSDLRLARAAGVTDICATLRRARAASAAQATDSPRALDTARAATARTSTAEPAAPITRAAHHPLPAGAARAARGAVCRHDPGYPEALSQLPSAPAVLHATCDPVRLAELLKAPAVVLLGKRHPTGYAREVTFALACELAGKGVSVVSGLHQGVDATAHHGALHAGGGPIAVTGCAAGIPYPVQLDHLHGCIAARGAVISEFPAGFYPPRPWCLLAAKRILGALTDVVVIVEASERSSTLLTAQVAAAAPAGAP